MRCVLTTVIMSRTLLAETNTSEVPSANHYEGQKIYPKDWEMPLPAESAVELVVYAKEPDC